MAEGESGCLPIRGVDCRTAAGAPANDSRPRPCAQRRRWRWSRSSTSNTPN